MMRKADLRRCMPEHGNRSQSGLSECETEVTKTMQSSGTGCTEKVQHLSVGNRFCAGAEAAVVILAAALHLLPRNAQQLQILQNRFNGVPLPTVHVSGSTGLHQNPPILVTCWI